MLAVCHVYKKRKNHVTLCIDQLDGSSVSEVSLMLYGLDRYLAC